MLLFKKEKKSNNKLVQTQISFIMNLFYTITIVIFYFIFYLLRVKWGVILFDLI